MINSKKAEPAGVALIVVLACLILVSTLIVVFVAGTTAELKSSKSYADGAAARLLSQSAINLVTAEIREATAGLDTEGNPSLWVSQPGMIRTFKNNGEPDRYFKLYSDTWMSGTGIFEPDAPEHAVPSNWFEDKAIYTDLNQPVNVNGVDNYPILDGNDLRLIAGLKTYDSDGNGSPDVEGFSIGNAPLGAGVQVNPVPMPARWLYVLANGRIVPPSGTGKIATVAGAETSPIVGRIAFWTDDESAKININTAAEGSYTDMPRFYSTYDHGALSRNQAAQKEFQRYPGHPAMTSLSTVLGSTLTPEQIYAIVPRVTGESPASGVTSRGGTQKPNGTPVTLDTDRLYASLDELLFKAAMDSSDPPVRRINDPTTANTALNRRTLEKSKFFLTAASRAPDVNLFNKPRVCIWPVHTTNSTHYRTVFDRLIAFCSTMNNHIYYFQRASAASATNDLPNANASSTTGLGRNRMLMEYLRGLTSSNVPGFGGNFAAKFGPDNNQILTEIFDYIRCANLRDAAGKTDPNFVQFAPPVSAPKSGGGQVIPIVDTTNQTRGFGRFPTISKAFFQFIGTATSATNSSVPVGRIRVRAAFFLEMFDPAFGFVGNYPRYRVRVSGLGGMQWGEGSAMSSMGFSDPGTLGTPNSDAFNLENFVGGPLGYSVLCYKKAGFYPFFSQTIDLPDPDAAATLSGSKFFNFSGGTIQIEILEHASNTILQTFSLNFPATTNSTRFPTPKLAPNNMPGSSHPNFRSFDQRIESNVTGTDTALSGAAWIIDKDVVRSVEANPGDIRLIAARTQILPSDNLFAPHSNYFNSNKRMAHSLRTGQGSPYYGATVGKLANVAYCGADSSGEYTNQGSSPTYAMNTLAWDLGNPSTTGVALGKSTPFVSGDLPGDWDNGFGNQRDGPYINKPDEGDVAPPTQPNIIPYFSDLRYHRIDYTYFSPNRQMPSAVMFGSLPTGVLARKPWQTLHFRAEPTGHPGLGVSLSGGGGPPYSSPPDHLLLDLFHMPVVEPYAISEPFSTAGRINMNFQIIPFTYIIRDTGVRAVLKSEKIIAVPDTAAGTYKSYNTPVDTTFRFDIDASRTLAGFQTRFDYNSVFRSPTEICSIPLIPVGTTLTGAAYWGTRRLTGDNSRERPYATIYPRLTTQSNTFTIHMRVQALKKVKTTNPGEWNESIDQVTGEYCGSQTIERYIDPNDRSLVDFAAPGVTETLADYYKFRVVNSKQFAP